LGIFSGCERTYAVFIRNCAFL